jgi:hypothetical protein
MRVAINLVTQDVVHELGELRLAVVVGMAEQISDQLGERFDDTLFERFRGLSRANEDILGWVLDSQGHGIALWGFGGLEWGSFVARVADTFQEGIIETFDHRGAAFPLCRVHGVHPMDSVVINDDAFWVCPKRLGNANTDWSPERRLSDGLSIPYRD